MGLEIHKFLPYKNTLCTWTFVQWLLMRACSIRPQDFLLTLGYGSTANLWSWDEADGGPDSSVALPAACAAAVAAAPIRDLRDDEARPASLSRTSRNVDLHDEFPGCDTFVHPSEIARRRSSGHFSEPQQESRQLHRYRWRPAMIQAVRAILAETGEDVHREVRLPCLLVEHVVIFLCIYTFIDEDCRWCSLLSTTLH